MKSSRILAPLVLALLAFGLPASSAADRSLEFAGKTHFTTTHPGEALIHLSDDVKVSGDPFGNNLANIDSTGRIAGIFMKQDVPKNGIEVIALSVALCAKPPCKEKRISFTHVWDPDARGFPRNVTLPAGDYFVRVVAEEPTTIDINLPGLGGETSIDVVKTDEVDMAVPKTTFDPLPQHNLYSAEAKQVLGGTGWALMAVEVISDNQVYGEVGTCLQEEKNDPVRSQLSVGFFFTGCNGSGAGSITYGLPTGPNREVIIDLTSLDKGKYFHGLSYKTVGQVQEVNAFALDVEFPRGKRSGGMSAGVFHSDEG